MDFGLAFSYVFQETDWVKKVLIAAVLLIIPIIGWLIVAGWAIEITRRVIRNEAPFLPEWSDFGKFIVDGLLIMVIGIIYSLPSMILNGIMQGVNIFAQDSLQGGGGDTTAIATGIMVVMGCVGCIVFLYSLLIGFGMPAVYANFAVKGNFGAAFNFSEIFGLLRAAPGAYVITFLGSIVAGFIGMLGLIACIIGVLATVAYSGVVNSHLWGQAYNEAQRVLNAPTAPLAPVA